jgi:uncharacterized protein (DUF1786 family)
MDYLASCLEADRHLSTFAALVADVPEIMTRLRAIGTAGATQSGLPVVVMDTAPAAVLGAREDPQVSEQPDALIVNVGNFHTLAFQFRGGQFVRLLEHHTGLLTTETLVGWLNALASGDISHAAVFADHGHGVLALDNEAVPLEFAAVVGPRRSMLRGAGLPTYFAVPHGDQMLGGCFGLLRASADVVPEWREAISAALDVDGDRSLW